MADEELVLSLDTISELRVVDLKKELERRGLAKSGSKKELVERLIAVTFFQFTVFVLLTACLK